jgi:hypothetical protein
MFAYLVEIKRNPSTVLIAEEAQDFPPEIRFVATHARISQKSFIAGITAGVVIRMILNRVTRELFGNCRKFCFCFFE